MTANHIELEKKYKHANINIERGGEGEGEREMQKKNGKIFQFDYKQLHEDGLSSYFNNVKCQP